MSTSSRELLADDPILVCSVGQSSEAVLVLCLKNCVVKCDPAESEMVEYQFQEWSTHLRKLWINEEQQEFEW